MCVPLLHYLLLAVNRSAPSGVVLFDFLRIDLVHACRHWLQASSMIVFVELVSASKRVSMQEADRQFAFSQHS